MLYSEELQAPQGGGIEVRQKSAWAAISNISSACLDALTSLEGACLSRGNERSESWVQRDMAISRPGAREDIFSLASSAKMPEQEAKSCLM